MNPFHDPGVRLAFTVMFLLLFGLVVAQQVGFWFRAFRDALGLGPRRPFADIGCQYLDEAGRREVEARCPNVFTSPHAAAAFLRSVVPDSDPREVAALTARMEQSGRDCPPGLRPYFLVTIGSK